MYTCKNIAAESSFALLYAPAKGSTLSYTTANTCSCTVVMKLQLHIYTCMYMYMYT